MDAKEPRANPDTAAEPETPAATENAPTATTPTPTTSGAPGLEGVAAIPVDALILITTRNLVLFPGTVLPMTLGRQRSIVAAQAAIRLNRPVGLVLQRDPTADDPLPAGLSEVGTEANLLRYVTSPDGSHHVICQGVQRFRIKEFHDGYPFFVARVEPMAESEEQSTAIDARLLNLRNTALEVLQLLPQTPTELVNAVQSVGSAPALADLIASFMDITSTEKQEVLETFEVEQRLARVQQLLEYRLEVLRLSRQISDRTKETLDDRQREFLLREQLKTIQKELGEGDDAKSQEIADLRDKIDAAKMPDEVEKHAKKELARLERMPEAAGEYSMARTYLEWLIELPWAVANEPPIDINEAREVLDADHYGLRKIKRRILEFLAIHKLNPGGRSPILCFVGPPGVGKTSLGQSIARATGREFVRVSLGGTHDEAEIRGHRRTYIGALPGNILQGIRRAGSRNCVMMLDEIDKLGHSNQGDPSSALLEVLDPEQNSTFRDNYLGVPFDLSRVIFITTANVLDNIPGPLRDRMEVIDLPGYTEDEKFEIAKRYLIGRQMKANGLKAEQVEIDDDAVRAIIRDYTREAGVRSLEREIGTTLRSAAMQIAEGSATQVHITPDDLHDSLGPRRFEGEVAMRTSIPGVATGLAWTPVGGDILFIEATRIPGRGGLILTGQLGDVMKESAQAALSLVKSKITSLGLDATLFESNDIHVHVPAGAIPKDGPSAGVAMFTALVSLLTGRTVNSETAMTGEISLRGLVLPVGGIKEKVVAAARAGLKTVILPARNKRDYEEIPEAARNALRFIWAERVEDVIGAALDPAAAPAPELESAAD
ncbi:MAG TPA: endopeptidase La [Stellaceae bacterium]|jgi:ATP-dependent Lon protease|nr:endopeptidase La [Stellaceae bacterium]